MGEGSLGDQRANQQGNLTLRPGIIIQHAREEIRETGMVRSDIAGFIGVVRPEAWPDGDQKGDFVEVSAARWSQVEDSVLPDLVDSATLHALRQFFLNGGQAARVFAVCIESMDDLLEADPNSQTWVGLFDRLRGQEDLGVLLAPVLAHVPYSYGVDGLEVPITNTLVMLLEHCKVMNNRFLIVDPPRDLHEQPLVEWVRDLRDRRPELSSYGAVYYPWLKNGEDVFAPSGTMAGIFGRVENEHAPFGVRWPPANQVLRGVTHPEVAIRWGETDELAREHINPILTQPTRGVVIWGARTLSREPRWVHINARRIVSMISEQVRRDSEWVVFENQRPELWEIVARSVRGRLDQLWSAGLLTGSQAGEDYEVRCDSETNPMHLRDQGEINVEVTLRPITTAEFIVVELRLGQ